MSQWKKRKDGRYVTRVTLPDGTGKDVYAKSEKELKSKLIAIGVKAAMGLTDLNNTIKVVDWIEQWWEVCKKGRMGWKTEQGYKLAINNYIIPAIGNMKIKDVKPIHIQQLINSMSHLSLSSQKNVKKTVNGIFKQAVINGLITGNPAQYIEYTASAGEGRNALSPNQVKELLAAAKDTRAELLIDLALYCGLRRGEIAALKWNDIDHKEMSLRINKSLEFRGNSGKEKSPKTKAGVRKIPIPPKLYQKLKNTEKDCIYIVPSTKKGQLTVAAINNMVKQVQKRVSFHFVLHQLRHTYSTNLHKLGVDAKTHQYLMGHADIGTTLNVYTHVQEDQIKNAAYKIADIYS